MPCLISKDQPLRIRMTAKGVVHAGDMEFRAAYTDGLGDKIPSRYVPVRVCRYGSVPYHTVIKPQTQITCKACMKMMGILEEPVFPKRYVVQEVSTGAFFKNTDSRCTSWSNALSDAFLYKHEHQARKRCMRNEWVGDDGTILQHTPTYKDGMKNFRFRRVPTQDYIVRAVNIVLEE